MVFVAPRSSVQDGKPMPLVVLDWASKKLVRMCRSSLSSEAQAAANGVDSLEWVKTYVSLIIDPTQPPQLDETMKKLGPSPVMTDAKALYDASLSTTAGLGITEKRTAIEVSIINQRMKAASAYWTWTNTMQQLADGLTKVSQRQALADIMARGVHALRYDPDFTAGKKMSAADRKAYSEELDAAAGAKQEDHYLVDETKAKCLLEGCGKAVPDEAGNRYCCRRHFYVDTAKKEKGHDIARKAKQITKTLLMVETLVRTPGADASDHEIITKPWKAWKDYG